MSGVNFTRSAAERISRVVRAVEFGDRDANALTFSRPWYGGGAGRLQLGTFTGNWAVGTYKVVTLTNSTSTVNVFNWCNQVIASTADTAQTRYVIFGRVDGTQTAVEIQMQSTSTECTATLTLGSLDLSTLPGFNAEAIQLLGHSAGSTTGDTSCTAQASLQWYSIVTCATATE